MNKILIGVTSFGRLSYTKKCLEALEATTHPFDCIIADNCSPNPEVKEFLKQYDPKVLPNGSTFKVLFLDQNYGVGKALNKILLHRKPEQHFMKLDNDVVMPSKIFTDLPDHLQITEDQVNPRWLDEMLDFLENNENNRFKSIAVYFYPRDRTTAAPLENIKTTTGNTYKIENPHNHMLGAGIMWHRDVMNELKTFAETHVYGYEDTKFSQASLRFGENAWAEWIYAKHIDQLDQGEDTDRILHIKNEALSGRLKVPK